MFSTVVFPDVSADCTQVFACTLQAGDIGLLAPPLPRPEPAEMDDAA
jgi:hypothetical protein